MKILFLQNNQWLFGDVRMCFSKNFELIDCERKTKMVDLAEKGDLTIKEDLSVENKLELRKESNSLPSFQTCPADGIIYTPGPDTC